MNMDNDQGKIASGEQGQAAACGPSPGPGCWPLPAEWDRTIPPQQTEICTFEILGGIKVTGPKWNTDWIRGLEAFVRSVAQDEIRKANPTVEGRTAKGQQT